jgi:adenylosuccinate lyase
MIARYSVQSIERIWSEQTKFNLHRDIEVAYLKAIKPDLDLTSIATKKISPSEIREIEKDTKHETVAFVKYLTQGEGEDIKRWVHYGLTSSDVLDSTFSIQNNMSISVVVDKIKDLRSSLIKLALELKTRGIIGIGRTHGIHAEPVPYEKRFLLFWEDLKRAQERISSISFPIKLRGPVGELDSGEAERVCSERFGVALFDGLTSQVVPRDIYARIILELAILASCIERFATEIRSLQRTEIGELAEGFSGGQYGSSAMPHKKNPIGSENLCGISRLIRSYVNPVLENIVLWHERDMSHSSVERVIFPDSYNLAAYSLDRMKDIIDNLVINEDRIRHNLAMIDHASQEKMNKLIEDGMSRFDAYSIARETSRSQGDAEHPPGCVWHKDWHSCNCGSF